MPEMQAPRPRPDGPIGGTGIREKIMLELLKKRGGEPAFILLQDAENMYRWVLQGGNTAEDATDDDRGQYDDPEDTSGHSDNPDDEAEEFMLDDDDEYVIDDEDDAPTLTIIPRKSD